jgi:hypothetical protein
MFEGGPPVTASDPDKKAQKKEAKRLEKAKKEKYKQLWRDYRARIAKDSDPVIQARKEEILSGFDYRTFMTRMEEEDFDNLIDKPMAFRGHVFESLVTKEMNNEEENSVLANFILKCLKKPEMLGIARGSLRNPDHLGVVVDVQTGEARVTGMYEVKVGKRLDERAQDQLRRFYGNLEMITRRLNAVLEQVKTTYGMDFIPEGGIKLLPEDEIDKFVVVPRTDKKVNPRLAQDKKQFLEGQGWGMRHSVFSDDNVQEVTGFMQKYYQENQAMIDQDRGKYDVKKQSQERDIQERARLIRTGDKQRK